MPDINCRVAKLEQRLDGLCRELTEDSDEQRRKMDKIFDKIDNLTEIVLEHDRTHEKQKGFLGGIVFIVSALFAAIGLVWSNWK